MTPAAADTERLSYRVRLFGYPSQGRTARAQDAQFMIRFRVAVRYQVVIKFYRLVSRCFPAEPGPKFKTIRPSKVN